MSADTVLSPYAARLAAELAGIRRVQVRLPELLAAWAAACPTLIGAPSQLAGLAAALDVLAAHGTVELPAAKSWDRTVQPPLPKFVTLPAARRVPTPPRWRAYPWGEPLGWVASLRYLSDSQMDDLVAINDWLARSEPETDVAPSRVRSAEIFGDEKALDRLMTTALFAPGRVSFELLRCRRFPPPLVVRTVGPGRETLVVENSDPYWLCVEVLSAMPQSPISRVAWGAGNGITQSIAALALEDPPPDAIWYWGDLDPEGVAIGANAAKAAAGEGLAAVPPVRPHVGLWLALTALEPTSPGACAWSESPPAWLGPQVWEASAGVRAAAGRVAQERLGTAAAQAALSRKV